MGGAAAKSVEAKGVWSPVTSLFTQVFLADVNDFLFNKAKRERMVQTVKDRATTGGGPFVVIGHTRGAWQDAADPRWRQALGEHCPGRRHYLPGPDPGQ